MKALVFAFCHCQSLAHRALCLENRPFDSASLKFVAVSGTRYKLCSSFVCVCDLEQVAEGVWCPSWERIVAFSSSFPANDASKT